MFENAQNLVNKLIELDYTVTTAESCTGGMISSALIDIAGASSVINESHVTYSNEAKEKYLGVKRDTLIKYDAVSEETAYEMALGASKIAGADIGIGVTGLAGPDGGTLEKPVGLVYVGYNICGKITVEQYNFSGERTQIREQTTQEVINHVLKLIS